MKPNTGGLDEILGLWANSVQDHPDMSMPILTLSDTEQSILQWVSETVIGPDCSEDEDGSGDSCEDCKADHGYYANVHNELRAEQREILRKEGWKDED